MSIRGPAGFADEQRNEYHLSQSMVPASGFLTPPSPFNPEGRRDSIASSQSSMSSFVMSDYSGPVTPTCGQSPMTDEGFVDVMGYDLSQNFQSQSMHGLPMTQPKLPGSNHELYGSWQVIPHATDLEVTQSSQYRPQLILPTTGEFLHTHLAEHTGLDTPMISTGDSSWVHVPPAIHSDMVRQWNSQSLGDYPVHDDNMPTFWATQMQSSQATQAQTIIMSDAMVDVESDLTHVDPQSFIDADSFDNADPSFPPSPQEVSFKREGSPSVKHESDAEENSLRLTRSIYVSPTGGKSVKKERRHGGPSRKRTRVTRHRDRHTVRFSGKNIDHKLDGVECQWDEETGEYKWYQTRPLPPKERCNHIDEVTGHMCTKSFQRPEHLKRHQATHNGEREFPCAICSKTFNRNDNCQEHHWTHVQKPGKKAGRNDKMSLAEVEAFCTHPITGPKLIEKLRQKWKTEVVLQGLAA